MRLVVKFEVSNPITQCSVILSEASLRAKSKDPHLVASSAWVADPSQAQDDSQPVEAPKRTGRCAKLAGVRARWTGDQARRLRVSRSGRIATDQKAVRRRGPGRVVLGSKPQLATAKKNSCAGPGSKPQLATTEKLVRWAAQLAIT